MISSGSTVPPSISGLCAGAPAFAEEAGNINFRSCSVGFEQWLFPPRHHAWLRLNSSDEDDLGGNDRKKEQRTPLKRKKEKRGGGGDKKEWIQIDGRRGLKALLICSSLPSSPPRLAKALRFPPWRFQSLPGFGKGSSNSGRRGEILYVSSPLHSSCRMRNLDNLATVAIFFFCPRSPFRHVEAGRVLLLRRRRRRLQRGLGSRHHLLQRQLLLRHHLRRQARLQQVLHSLQEKRQAECSQTSSPSSAPPPQDGLSDGGED